MDVRSRIYADGPTRMAYRKISDHEDYIATCGLTVTAFQVLFIFLTRVEVDYTEKDGMAIRSKAYVTITAEKIATLLHGKVKTIRESIQLLSEKELVIRVKKWEYAVNPKYFWHYGEWIFRQDMQSPNIDIYTPAVEYWQKTVQWYKEKKERQRESIAGESLARESIAEEREQRGGPAHQETTSKQRKELTKTTKHQEDDDVLERPFYEKHVVIQDEDDDIPF